MSDDDTTHLPSRARSPIIPVSIAAAAAIICTAILMLPSIASLLPAKEAGRPSMAISETMRWDGVRIDYTWVTTQVSRFDSGIPETLTFAEGVIYNMGATTLEVTGATLQLVETHGVPIGHLYGARTRDISVPPGESR